MTYIIAMTKNLYIFWSIFFICS